MQNKISYVCMQQINVIYLQIKIIIIKKYIYIDMATIDLHDLNEGNNQVLQNLEKKVKQYKPRKNIKIPLNMTSYINKADMKNNFNSLTARSNAIIDKATQLQSEKKKAILPFISTLPKLTNKQKSYMNIDKSYLEQWLDSALAEEQSNVPLKTVKKYEIDKRYLIGQNLSNDEIDKLYHTLYIYTHGIKKLFEQILGNKDLLVMKFWKVFLKLLQKSSEYESIFQLIDLKQEQSLEVLRNLLKKKQEEFSQMKKEFNMRESELMKEIINRKEEIKELINEKNIVESNLQLTDEAFNQEVSLRLKFEQRINAINTAYAELKLKYNRSVEEVKIYKQEKVAQRNRQQLMIQELSETRIKIKQLQKLLQLEKQKMKFKEVQIAEVRQEVFDVKQDQLVAVKNEADNEAQMQKFVSREKNYRFRLSDEREFKEALEKTVKEKTKEIQVLSTTIKEERTRLYKEYNKVQNLKQQINQKNKVIQGKDYEINLLKQEQQQLKSQIQSLKNQCEELLKDKEKLQRQCELNSRRIMTLESDAQANEKTIAELRVVREKYQKLNNILMEEHKQLMASLNEANTKIIMLKEEIRQHLMTIQNKEFKALEIQGRLQAHIEIEKRRTDSLLNQMQQQENNIKALEEKYLAVKNESDVKNFTIDRLKSQCHEAKNETIRTMFQLRKLEGTISIMRDQENKYKMQIESFNKMILDSKKSYSELSKKNESISYILEEKRKNISEETSAVKLALLTYKKHIEERAQYMHPMLFWDIEAQNQRLLQINEKRLEKYKLVDEEIQKLNNYITSKQTMIQKYESELHEAKAEIINLNTQIAQEIKTKKMTEKEVQTLQTKLKKKDNEYLQIKKKCDNLDAEYREIIRKKLEGVHKELQTTLHSGDYIQKEIQIQTEHFELYNNNQKNNSNEEKINNNNNNGIVSNFTKITKNKQIQKQKSEEGSSYQRKYQNAQKYLDHHNKFNEEDQEVSEEEGMSSYLNRKKISSKIEGQNGKSDNQNNQSSIRGKNRQITNKEFTTALKIAYLRK